MLADEINLAVDRLQQVYNLSTEAGAQKVIENLESAATELGRAWSGSPIGYHSRVYYEDLNPPPPTAFFDIEWGLMESMIASRTAGDWRVFRKEEIEHATCARAGSPDMTRLRETVRDAEDAFVRCKMDVLSAIQVAQAAGGDEYLLRLNRKIERLSSISKEEAERELIPARSSLVSRDSTAAFEGQMLPPHLDVISEAMSLKSVYDAIESIVQMSNSVQSHIARLSRYQVGSRPTTSKVFIGHGHSPVWRELKDFIVERLSLPVDEFNRVPAAGSTTVDRLKQMLDEASLAFLVMTGEEVREDGQFQARLNVIHEAGLFQGRLGFNRAIVLLEEGCGAFSNIEGLVQIRFGKDNIKEAFEDVRQVLEREGVL